MQPYLVPLGEAKSELTVINSLFITHVSRAETPEQAKEYIAEIKQKYRDASHNVPAYIIGFGPTVMEHCSDAGEPAGTAGKPILSILRGSNIGDIVMVVTRYFGGTKLGTGGLVHAYGDAAKAGLQVVRLAQKTFMSTVALRFAYKHYDNVKKCLESWGGIAQQEVFEANVQVVISIRESDSEHLIEAIQKNTNHQVDTQILETTTTVFIPVPYGKPY